MENWEKEEEEGRKRQERTHSGIKEKKSSQQFQLQHSSAMLVTGFRAMSFLLTMSF